MLMSSASPCGVHLSILGQPWRWRAGAEGGEGFEQDDLVARLLLARGVMRDDLSRHRTPTLRAFMPDPSLFRDMDEAANRLADAVERGSSREPTARSRLVVTETPPFSTRVKRQ